MQLHNSAKEHLIEGISFGFAGEMKVNVILPTTEKEAIFEKLAVHKYFNKTVAIEEDPFEDILLLKLFLRIWFPLPAYDHHHVVEEINLDSMLQSEPQTFANVDPCVL